MKINCFLFLLLTAFSCALKETSINNIDAEIEFIELHKTINSLKVQIQILKTHKNINKADSLSRLMIDYQNELDSLSSKNDMDLELAESNCINHFGLDSMSLNEQKVNYLFLYNAYKVCRPGYISCGFGPTITSDENYNKFSIRLSNAENNYINYIDSILNLAINKSFPEVKESEIIAFYHSSEVVLKNYKLFDDVFNKNACDYAKKDSIFMDLYLNVNKARFEEL